MYSQPHVHKPAEKKSSWLIIACFACIALLICGGAAFFLMQKYNIGITEQDDGASPRSDYEPDDTEPSSVAEPPVTTDANNKDFTIGDLFNNVNPAVATVITYDSGNNKFNQGSGFFINEDGHFITNYHVVRGAYSVVVQMKDEIELKVAYVLAENEEKDLIKLAVDIPSGSLEPGMWLDINPERPNVADKIIVIGTPMGLGRTVSDGIISAIREIPDRGLVFQMTAPISSGSSGSPVIDMHGKVVGVAFLQIVNGQNLNFAIPGENIVKLKVQQLLNLAAWSERKNTESNNKFEYLRKEIVKHIKSEKPGAKIEKSLETVPSSKALKSKLASQIIKESGIAKQNKTFKEKIEYRPAG